MAPLISFLIGIQILHAVATSPPLQFVYPSCNSSEVKAAAEAALDQLNAHRRQGYVLGLQRIYDVYQIPEWFGDSLFYLNINVLETECHVLSRKLWKECKFRSTESTLYGQCKVIIQFNRNSNDVHLYSYNCALQPFLPKFSFLKWIMLPLQSPSTRTALQDTAEVCLTKFNTENGHRHYFAILNIAVSKSMRLSKEFTAVEFTIQETSCPKSPSVSNVTQCPLLPTETAETGLCKGKVTKGNFKDQNHVTVNCTIFPPPPPVTDEETTQSRSENQEPDHPPPSADVTETPPKRKETIGRVLIYPPLKKYAIVEVQELNLTSTPRLAFLEQEGSPHSAKLAGPAIPPFPRGFSESAQCPGDIAIKVPGLELPSPTRAPASQSDTQGRASTGLTENK